MKNDPAIGQMLWKAYVDEKITALDLCKAHEVDGYAIQLLKETEEQE
jgi:hypothetical protein